MLCLSLLPLAALAVGAVPTALPQLRVSASRLHAVSLRGLEAEAKTSLVRGARALDSLTLGGLTDIVGYRSANGDIEVLGLSSARPEAAILVRELVEALRAADHSAVGMTLLPRDVGNPRSPHQVVVFPSQLEDTAFAGRLIAADYAVKELATSKLAQHHRQAIKSCPVSDGPPSQALTGRVFFLPAAPRLELDEETDGSFSVLIREAGVILAQEGSLVFHEDGRPSGGSAQAPDQALGAFTAEFTRRFAEMGGVYQRLGVAYRLFLVAKLLRREKVDWNADFWLRDYPLGSQPTPRELPALRPQTVRHTCWGLPYAQYDYAGLTLERRIWGGVLIAYGDETLSSSARAAPSEVGAALGASASTASEPGYTPRSLSAETRALLSIDSSLGRAGGNTAQAAQGIPLPLGVLEALFPQRLTPSGLTGLRVSFDPLRSYRPLWSGWPSISSPWSAWPGWSFFFAPRYTVPRPLVCTFVFNQFVCR